MTNRHQFIRQITAFGLTAGLLLGFAAACIAQAPAGKNIPQLPELNWEQRSDWLNVRSAAQMADIGPAAVGDGVADDTVALLAALNEIHGKQGGSPFSTVYLPPGTYRITRELYPRRHETVRHYQSLHIRGHGRSTRIVWDGPEGGTMFRAVQWSHSTFIGVVWDGSGKAARGFVHDGGNDTGVLHQHQAFVNFTVQGSGTTEPSRPVPGYLEGSEWSNCLFVNCGKGLALWEFNDYVFTIDGCEFHDNGYGVWGERGQFYVRNCHFERSTQADIRNNNEIHGCSARRCTSVGSRAFYERQNRGPLFTIQDCHVSGWTNPAYAVISSSRSGANLLIFDCTFTNAPSPNPPIRLEGATPVMHSNNRTVTAALFAGSLQHVVEVPKGERTGSLISAQRSFFRSEAAIPTKVFDAKRDFNAKGDGRTDDTDAVQRTIDAARQHGRGAIAYLPRGRYRTTKTIHISGGNYYVGGANLSSALPEANILVTDPQNVTLKNLDLLGSTLRQVSTVPQPSRMHYQHVYHTKSFEMVGLSKDSVVTVSRYASSSGLLIENCSSARILFNYHVGRLRVKGAQVDRSGFLGVLASQGCFLIEDNQSLVGGDCYHEQMGNIQFDLDFPFAILRGSPTLPPGRVTLSSPKLCGFPIPGNLNWRQEPFEEYFIVDNYRGRLSSVLVDYYNPTPTYDPGKNAFKIVCSGESPIDILLMANNYGRVKPVIEGGKNVTHTLLANWFSRDSTREPIPDALHADSPRLAALALDDYRELGALDLELNHAAPDRGAVNE